MAGMLLAGNRIFVSLGAAAMAVVAIAVVVYCVTIGFFLHALRRRKMPAT